VTRLGDRTTFFYEGVADDTALPIRWTILKAWADGPGTTDMASFRELVDVEAYELWPDPATVPTRMAILDVGRHDRALLGLAFFNTELTTVPRRWKWSYTWPGTWTPLRERYSDWSEYDPRPTYNPRQRLTALTVSFIFPTQANEPRVEPVPGTPPCTQEPDVDPHTGGPVFTCRVDDPGRGVLHWNLRVAGWE
jgi:hypothetical protein